MASSATASPSGCRGAAARPARAGPGLGRGHVRGTCTRRERAGRWSPTAHRCRGFDRAAAQRARAQQRDGAGQPAAGRCAASGAAAGRAAARQVAPTRAARRLEASVVVLRHSACSSGRTRLMSRQRKSDHVELCAAAPQFSDSRPSLFLSLSQVLSSRSAFASAASSQDDI